MAAAHCPDSLDGAASDPGWATERLKSIPRKEGTETTRGLFYGDDGTEHEYQSGSDGAFSSDAKFADEILGQSPAPFGGGNKFTVSKHVEIKVAAAMRKSKTSYGVLVINKVGGPCGGPAGCKAALPLVLAVGAVLVIWWPDAAGKMIAARFVGGEIG